MLLSQDYTLIVGMPGTGKTTTICTLVNSAAGATSASWPSRSRPRQDLLSLTVSPLSTPNPPVPSSGSHPSRLWLQRVVDQLHPLSCRQHPAEAEALPRQLSAPRPGTEGLSSPLCCLENSSALFCFFKDPKYAKARFVIFSDI